VLFMRNRACLPLLAALLAGTLNRSPALAQNADTAPPDESLLVTASRLPQAADDIAAGVTVIDRATILARGYVTLADALSAVAGAHLVQSGGPGENASLFLRGADSDQVQVLIDGVPVNDASGPGGAYNFGVETLADVARIEVVRGPLSAVYGSGAIGGVVNIITERGTATPHGDVLLAAGLPAAVLGQADLRGRSGAFDYNLSAESQSQRGFDATPQGERVYTGERDGYRSTVAAADLGYTPVAGTRLFVDLRGRSSVYGYDDVGYPAFDDPNETGRDNDFFIRGGVDSSLLDGAWRTGLVVSHDQEYRRYVNLLDATDPNQAAENSRYLGQRTDVQWNNSVILPDSSITHATTLTAGYEHSTDTAHERLNSSYAGFPYLASVDATDNRDAGYLGATTTFAQRLVITGNLREQSVSGVGDDFTWRIGGSYALPAIATHLKASYGTAFVAPSLFDRYGIDSDGYIGNPALRPERSHGYEIGWVGDLGAGNSLAVTYFHTIATDLIETEFSPVYTSQNVNAARLQGVETTLHLHPAPWIDADLTYTYTDARNRDTGQLLLRRPYDTGSATLTLRPLPDLSLTPQLTFAGGDLDEVVDNGGYPIGSGRNPGGAVLNLNAEYKLRPQLAVFAWGKNIANSHYEAASGYATPGPSFLAGVRMSY
jgi:vitamin B12 transporter